MLHVQAVGKQNRSTLRTREPVSKHTGGVRIMHKYKGQTRRIYLCFSFPVAQSNIRTSHRRVGILSTGVTSVSSDHREWEESINSYWPKRFQGTSSTLDPPGSHTRRSSTGCCRDAGIVTTTSQNIYAFFDEISSLGPEAASDDLSTCWRLVSRFASFASGGRFRESLLSLLVEPDPFSAALRASRSFRSFSRRSALLSNSCQSPSTCWSL